MPADPPMGTGDCLARALSMTGVEGPEPGLRIGDLPRAFLLWRSFAQWIGGIGILVLMQTLLPATFENQGSLIKSESTGVNTDNIFFNRKNTSRAIYAIYIGMTLLQAVLLKLSGLSSFDSIPLLTAEILFK